VALLTLIYAVSLFTVGEASAKAPPEPHDVILDVRGAKMHFRVYPGNGKTILLESGFGLGADTWNEVAPRLALRTGATVVSYDRAGMGSSEGISDRYDIHDEVARLHTGLYMLGHDRWVVLVGHSYGGYLIQLYSNLYPGDIHGLVYVDANTVVGIDGIGGAATLAAPIIRNNDVADPTVYQRANLRLSRELVATQEIMRRYPVVCGVPIDVITAGEPWPDTPTAVVEGWRSGHRDLVTMSGGRALIAEKTGHMVQRDNPGIVIDAAADVLRRAPANGAQPGKPGVPCAR